MAVDILKRYESYLNEKKFCSSTIKTYKNHFQHFKNFLDKNNLDMHLKNVRKYLLYLFKEKHYSNIKSQKMQVFISSPQNKNNRYVLLSHKLLKSFFYPYVNLIDILGLPCMLAAYTQFYTSLKQLKWFMFVLPTYQETINYFLCD